MDKLFFTSGGSMDEVLYKTQQGNWVLCKGTNISEKTVDVLTPKEAAQWLKDHGHEYNFDVPRDFK